MRLQTGKITTWNDDKGFGFINPKSGGKTVFFHINDFSKNHNRPAQGLSVRYNLSADPKGRKCAVNVYPQRGHRKATKTGSRLLFSASLSLAFFSGLGGLVFINKLPIIIPGMYAALSVMAFALYAKDKSAAQLGNWRTSESTLHLISLLGGWPGAMIAQNKLRHKSKKISFKVVYWITVIMNCGVLGWLLTPDGTRRLELLIEKINLG